MQEIGRAPQSERNLQTQFPGQTDRRTDERAGASKSWTVRGTDNIDLGAPGPDAALIMHRP